MLESLCMFAVQIGGVVLFVAGVVVIGAIAEGVHDVLSLLLRRGGGER